MTNFFEVLFIQVEKRNHPRVFCRQLANGTVQGGVAVFAFFLIKGLAWLVVPAAIAAFAMKGD